MFLNENQLDKPHSHHRTNPIYQLQHLYLTPGTFATFLTMTPLRDYLNIKDLSPQWNNVLCTLLMILYVKLIVMETATWLFAKRGQPRTRIYAHLALSSCIILWPLFDPSDWSWRLNALVPSVVATRLIYKVWSGCISDTLVDYDG
jgi:hypothetical protein